MSEQGFGEIVVYQSKDGLTHVDICVMYWFKTIANALVSAYVWVKVALFRFSTEYH